MITDFQTALLVARPGDRVSYTVPNSDRAKCGKIVIKKDTHFVLDAGGRFGIPKVVTEANFQKLHKPNPNP